jgi:membrane-bound serine protease (ClpP class)
MDLQSSMFSMAAAMVVTGGLILVLARFLPKSAIFQRIVLAETSAPGGTDDSEAHIGMTGTALTPLHPSGAGEFGGARLSVVARGEFIDAGSPIVIAETHGNRIVVDRTDHP